MATHYNLIIFPLSMPSTFNVHPIWLFITFWISLPMECLNWNTNCAQILHTTNETWLHCTTLKSDGCHVLCALWFTILMFFRNMIHMKENINENIRCQLKYEIHIRMTNTFTILPHITDFRLDYEQFQYVICAIRDLWMLSVITITNILSHKFTLVT